MDLNALIVVASSVGTTVALLLVFAAGWIAARRTERPTPAGPFDGSAAAPDDGAASSRVMMADVRERLRRLEAIAAGIDL